MQFHNPPATFVRNLQIKTADLERAVQFYRDVVGFQVLEQNHGSARLSADGIHPILSLVQPAEAQPKQYKTTGLYHFALLLPQRSDLARFVAHLTKKNVSFGASHHLVSEAVYFYDPDDNGIEVYVDTDPTTWNWRENGVTMDTIPLDFDDLLSAADLRKELWEGLPPQTIIGHIHLHVSHLLKAEIFYTRGLGFEVVARYRDSALFLSTDKYHHHIALNTWNGVGAPRPSANSVGLDYFTLAFPNPDRLKKCTADLEALGIEVLEVGTDFRVQDPAGNAILLTTEP